MSLPDVTIIGNLTADPELRTVGNGAKVVNFTIAANQRRLNKQTNQWEDGDVWFLNCNAWDGDHHMLASNIAASLRKGMTVMAYGRVRQRGYQAKDGSKRYSVEMMVEHVGPSLRKSAVAVSQPQSQSGGFQPQSGFNAQGGFQQAATQQQAPVSDPWSAGQSGFGELGGFGHTEFTDTSEPEF